MKLKLLIFTALLLTNANYLKSLEISIKTIWAEGVAAQKLYKKFSEDLLDFDKVLAECLAKIYYYCNFGYIKDCNGKEVKNINFQDVNAIKIEETRIIFFVENVPGDFEILVKINDDKKIATKVVYYSCAI